MLKRTAATAVLAAMFASGALAGIPAQSVLKAYLSRRSGDFAGSAEHLRTALKADPQSIELRIKLVRILMVFGEPDQGIGILDEGLKLNPDNPELLFEKAKTLVVAGRNAEAAESALLSAEKGGRDNSYSLAVRLLANAGRTDKALEVAGKWIEGKPQSPADAYYERASVFLRLGEIGKATADMTKVLELNPDHPQALEVMASISAQNKDRATALKYYEKLIRLNVHNAQARLAMAQLLLDDNRVEEARKATAEAERFVGSDPGDRLRLGLLYLQANQPEKSLINLEQIPEDARDARSWFFLGLVYSETGKFEAALKAFEKVDQASPLYDDMLLRKATALKETGKKEEALELLKNLKNKLPDNPEVVLALCAMLQSLDRPKEGLALLQDFYTSHQDIKEPGFFFSLGTLYDKLGDWEKSVELMKRVIELNPDDAHALNYLGYTWAEHGLNLVEAEAMVKKAIRLLPLNGYIVDSLGWVYFKQGKFAEAVRELEGAVALSAEDAIIWEHLGDARSKAGDREGAKKAYEKSLSLDPPGKTVGKKLEELR